MKLVIASDIHGCAGRLEQLLAFYARQQACRLVLLGDLLYHGPRNGVPQGYDPQRTADLLNAASRSLVCVHGNCDAEVDQLLLNFNTTAENLLLFNDGLTVFATHGHKYNLQALPQLNDGDVLLHGHTHVPAAIKQGGITYINPGSVSLPKENSCHSCIVLDGRAFNFINLDTDEVYNSITL